MTDSKQTLGTRLNTPNFSTMMAENVPEEMLLSMKHLGDNWENREDTPCPKCNGTGINPQFPEDGFCHACEGTGIHYSLYYGMKDGAIVVYADEYGIDFIKEYCKARREAHTEQQLAGKLPEGIIPYVIPKVIEFELIARGYEPHQFNSGKYIRQIANIMAKEYPDFMCVNYTRF